jgi:hypothetical protein
MLNGFPFRFGARSRTLERPPLALTLLTYYDILMVGVVPGAIALIQHFSAPPEVRGPILGVFGSLLLSAGVIWAATDAWYGRPWARYGLMALVGIYYGGLAFGAPWTVDLAAVLHPGASTLETVLRMGRSIFWVGLHGAVLFHLGRSHFRSHPA